MKTLAVIIAAREAGHWLRQCLESVAAQRLPPGWRMRILVGIDECCSTLRVARQIRCPQLDLSYFPTRVGPYVVFNSLACTAGADVLDRFDADDIMLDMYLKAQLDRLGSASSPMITQTWSVYVDEQLRPVAALLANGRRTRRDGRRDGPSDGQFLMTSPVWQRLGSFRPWWCHGDTEFLTRAKWAGIPRTVIPQHLYVRRVHPASLSLSQGTGYQSRMRNSYAREVLRAAQRYPSGQSPERVWPMVAVFVPGDSVGLESTGQSTMRRTG
jgi:hypothetical protein